MINLRDIRKGHKTQRDKYGKGLSDEMRRRQKLSHKKQLEKYGGEEGLSEEMKRRANVRYKGEDVLPKE